MNRKSIAEKLTMLRGNRKRSEVAEEIGISVSALSMYEAGNRVPRDEIKVSIAHHYGTTVEALFFGEEPHNSCGSEMQSSN